MLNGYQHEIDCICFFSHPNLWLCRLSRVRRSRVWHYLHDHVSAPPPSPQRTAWGPSARDDRLTLSPRVTMGRCSTDPIPYLRWGGGQREWQGGCQGYVISWLGRNWNEAVSRNCVLSYKNCSCFLCFSFEFLSFFLYFFMTFIVWLSADESHPLAACLRFRPGSSDSSLNKMDVGCANVALNDIYIYFFFVADVASDVFGRIFLDQQRQSCRHSRRPLLRF